MDKHYRRGTGFIKNLEQGMRLIYLKPPSSQHATKTLRPEWKNIFGKEEEDDEEGKEEEG
jgi:hypothetical protein